LIALDFALFPPQASSLNARMIVGCCLGGVIYAVYSPEGQRLRVVLTQRSMK
jgi:hypothetical protein